jgi:hypothetical protein
VDIWSGSSAGIATSNRLDGPGSIAGISGFSLVLFSYVLLTYVFLYYLCITVYVLFIVYVTLRPGIRLITVGNIYIYIYICIYILQHCIYDTFPSNVFGSAHSIMTGSLARQQSSKLIVACGYGRLGCLSVSGVCCLGELVELFIFGDAAEVCRRWLARSLFWNVISKFCLYILVHPVSLPSF